MSVEVDPKVNCAALRRLFDRLATRPCEHGSNENDCMARPCLVRRVQRIVRTVDAVAAAAVAADGDVEGRRP